MHKWTAALLGIVLNWRGLDCQNICPLLTSADCLRPLGPENLLLRGARLKNTKEIFGRVLSPIPCIFPSCVCILDSHIVVFIHLKCLPINDIIV